ncbi:MAG: hypothetical protein PQJ49_11160 [Sphaerochaetaceae bacterium]|nr:hypothetical protein [Sphaerochaetaceae bacterium]
MSEYNFEMERERRKVARWNTFLFLLACAIVAYIVFNFSDYKSSILTNKSTKEINNSKVLNNNGVMKIHDFRNNIVFESNSYLNVEVLSDKGGFIVKNQIDEIVGAFLGDGWYSLEIIEDISISDENKELPEMEHIEELSDNVKQTN